MTTAECTSDQSWSNLTPKSHNNCTQMKQYNSTYGSTHVNRNHHTFALIICCYKHTQNTDVCFFTKHWVVLVFEANKKTHIHTMPSQILVDDYSIFAVIKRKMCGQKIQYSNMCNIM